MKRAIAIVPVLFCFLLVTCATMSPMQKSTMFMQIYNKQYEDYQTNANRLHLTDEQRNYFQIKRRLLEELYPLIQSYNYYIVAGELPSEELEELIDSKLEALQYE